MLHFNTVCLCVSSGSPAHSQTEYEITIVGPYNKKHVWVAHRRPTLAEIERVLAKNYQDMIAADYTLTWKISNEVQENFEVYDQIVSLV